MRCSKAKEQLALYVGGDLPSDLQPELLTHLETCRECAKELADLKRSGAIVQKLADKDSPIRFSGGFEPKRLGDRSLIVQVPCRDGGRSWCRWPV